MLEICYNILTDLDYIAFHFQLINLSALYVIRDNDIEVESSNACNLTINRIKSHPHLRRISCA